MPGGTWLVDVARRGVESAAGFPALVEIREGETTRVDIDVDTGIR